MPNIAELAAADYQSIIATDTGTVELTAPDGAIKIVNGIILVAGLEEDDEDLRIIQPTAIVTLSTLDLADFQVPEAFDSDDSTKPWIVTISGDTYTIGTIAENKQLRRMTLNLEGVDVTTD